MGPPARAIAHLRSEWDAQVRPSSRRALVAGSFSLLFLAAQLARLGTPLTRALAAVGLFAVAVGLLVRAVVLRSRRDDPCRIVRDTVTRMDPELGATMLRALTLVDRTRGSDAAGSPALAGLHLQKLVERAATGPLVAFAARHAARWSGTGLAFGLVALGVVLVEPMRVVEGLDVLVARAGEAPLRLLWIDEVEMTAAPPEYLHAGPRALLPFAQTAQPRGTTVTVRGRPIHEGRALVLTDGQAEVPFLADGAGGVVARWTLLDSTELFVAARFGRVRIRQADAQTFESIADEAPRVTVEKAPRTVRLLDEPDLPIHYQATDDHGLREVDLVLRAGGREERRVLSSPSADQKVDRGGYQLRASDPFFKHTYVPVEVTVEARDNDTVAGPKWGKSPALLILLPQVGEPEARRYAAFLKVRGAATDLLAGRLVQKGPEPREAAEHVKEEKEAQAALAREVDGALSGSYGGLGVKRRLAALARGQLRRLDRALEAERKAPSADTHHKLIAETEDALLAFDAGLHGLGYRDAQIVALRLADVADEAAASASGERASESGRVATLGGATADARLDAAVQVLDGAGKQLLALGDLGKDLGEIVQNDLRRIDRARRAKDLPHAALAARDLAARLRLPEPSFGGGGGGGVESGSGQAPESGPPSDAEDKAAKGEHDLEDLARDHASQLDEVAQTLEKATPPEELEALKEEAKKHADLLREAVKNLPQGGEPDSARGAAATGRSQAEAMAGALERAQPKDAAEAGAAASKALAEARRRGEQSAGGFAEERVGREAEGAKEVVDRELALARKVVEQLQRAASERAKDSLTKSSKGEGKLAERAQDLGKKGQSGEGSVPQETLDRLGDAEQAMRAAQRALQEGDGDSGLRHQRDAQRLLEMARGEKGEQGGEEPDGKGAPAGRTEIPGKDAHQGPVEFRKRVLEGLARTGDPLLKDAVKRYAEGLLQ